MIEKIKNYLNEFKIGTKLMFKEFFKKDTNKKQHANMWTFSRLVSAFLIAICSVIAILTLNPVLFVMASSLTSFGAITDYFDGKSARKYDSCSEYGKLLDQVTDKVFTGLVGLSLLLVNPYYMLALLGEGLIAGINIGYSSKHKELKINSTLVGRIKQWPLFASLVLGFLSPINNILLTISNLSVDIVVIMQLLTTVSYIKQNNEEIKKINTTRELSSVKDIETGDKEKVKSLELTKGKSIEVNNKPTLSRKEQYQALRNVLNEIIKTKNEDNILSNEFQLKK